MPRYLFTVELSGLGQSEAEAWADAVEQFTGDPGEPHEITELPDDPFAGTDREGG